MNDIKTFFVYFLLIVLSFGVINSAIDCLERLVSKLIFYVSCGMLILQWAC